MKSRSSTRPLTLLLFFICLSSVALIISPTANSQQNNSIILISEATSTRAIALESPTWKREPFQPTSELGWNATDARTRIVLFAINLNLQQGDDASAVTAEAEDASHRIYPLKVEAVELMPGYDWLYAVVVRLNDQMGDLGDVLVRIKARGATSNRVRVGIGHIGGGPPDDTGAVPTPIQFKVQGRIASEGKGIGGITLNLSGKQNGSTVTDGEGFYSFTVMEPGDYTITPSAIEYTFAPASQTFNNLRANKTADFIATPTVFSIRGQVKDENGNNLSGATIALSGDGKQATATTDENGNYSFSNLRSFRSYTVEVSKAHYDFSPTSHTIASLSKDETLNFSGKLKLYSITGHVTDTDGTVSNLSGVTITLSGAQQLTTTTDDSGNYSFNNLRALRSYTVNASKTDYDFSPSSYTINSLIKDETLNFSGALKFYSITGRVTDTDGNAFANLQVTLSDGTNSSTTRTNAAGAYSFSAKAHGNYSITPQNAPYMTLQTASRNINFLQGNQDSLNFTGTRKTYTLQGRVLDDKGAGLVGVGVLLDSTNGPGAVWGFTGNDGSFSFTNVKGGYSYSLKPADTGIHSFTAQQAAELSQDLVLNFDGKRRTYSISGTFKDQFNNPLAGVTVQLSGPFNRSVTTDGDGNYVLSDLPANETYQLVPSKPNHIFEPQSQTLHFLSFDRKADFKGLRTYVVKGQVKDAGGGGLMGITVTLNGPQPSKATTKSDGTYSFTVTASGSYTVTPSIEQDYYVFSPSSHALNVNQNEQTANFAAALMADSNPSYVLEFDGSQADVEYGLYWPWDVDLGHFFWEFWAMAGDDGQARYLISDGYGGAHVLLFGYGYSDETSRYTLTGNIFDGTASTSFASDEGPFPKEWAHVAIGWDGEYIVIYYNGVPVGRRAFNGPRISHGPTWGMSWLLIGGSDHQNLIGRIAQVRAFEGRNPREGAAEASFAPQTLFEKDGNLLSYYFRPAIKVADLSDGYNGSVNPGTLRGTSNGVHSSCDGCPTPKFVIDPTAPNFSNPSNPGQITTPVDTPTAVPAAARVFDSFSRGNSTYILGGMGGIGSTEGGAAGTRTWQTGGDASGPQPFGILNGRAVLLKDERSVAWIDTGAGVGNLDIRVDRRTRTLFGSGVNTGISFRVLDAGNYFFAYTTNSDADDASKPQVLNVGYYLNGQRTDLAANVAINVGTSEKWQTLRVVTNTNGTINIYAGTVLVYSTSSNILATATGAGLYNNAKGMALTNRWDNFTVYDAP